MTAFHSSHPARRILRVLQHHFEGGFNIRERDHDSLVGEYGVVNVERKNKEAEALQQPLVLPCDLPGKRECLEIGEGAWVTPQGTPFTDYEVRRATQGFSNPSRLLGYLRWC